jgi:hypothetical protein
MASVDSTIYLLNSKDRASGSVQSANFNMINSGTIGPGTYEAMSYHSKNQVYNVELGVNDSIYFDEGGSEFTAVLDPGYYDIAALLIEVDDKMDNAGGTVSYTITYNTMTGKFNINNDTPFKLNFDVHTADPIADKLLGYDVLITQILANDQLGDFPADLTLHSQILINIDQDSAQNVTILDGTEFSLQIPLNGDYQEDIDSMKQETFSQTVVFSTNLNSLDIQLFTEDGVALVNTPDYELSLRKLF